MTKPVALQDRDLQLFLSLFESRVMTLAHAAALIFDGKTESAKKRIQKLKAGGYLSDRRGSRFAPSLLSLTRKALSFLKSEGHLQNYPTLNADCLTRRLTVSERTLAHELQVLDVKVSFHKSILQTPGYSLETFTTWPLLCQFHAFKSANSVKEMLVQPDAFIRIGEQEGDIVDADHSFFLELDRSTETLDLLIGRANAYLDHYRSGDFAVRNGGSRDAIEDFPFRVVVVLENQERRNNLAERLLGNVPSILRQVYLTTFEEVTRDPLGKIWVRPVDYREATKNSAFAPPRSNVSRLYLRQTVRDRFVESAIVKLGLIDESAS